MIRAHAAALKALLEAGVAGTVAADKVYVTKATGAPPYVVLHPDQGRAESTSLNGQSDSRRWIFATSAVGTTAEQSELFAEKVFAALLDVRPVIAGRVTSQIEHQTSLTIDRDEDVQPPVFVARDVWALTTLPA